MNLQQFLINHFKSWRPTAPEVISRTKRDITLSWEQEEYAFLKDYLLYRVERNNKLPKWTLVYSGGKTTKRIDDLAPSHPYKFKLKVILKAAAVQHFAAKAIEYFGDEKTVFEKFFKDRNDTDGKDGEIREVESGGGDNSTNIKVIIEDASEID